LNRRAIELSVNFIVMFILAMAMFSVGLYIVKTVFFKADELKKQLDENTRDQIERVLTEGSDRVIVPIVLKNVRLGGHEVFGVGLRNDLGHDNTFYIDIKCDSAFKPDNSEICGNTMSCDCDSWFGGTESTAIVKNGDKEVIELFVFVPKSQATAVQKGTYIFNMKIFEDQATTKQYDTTKKIKVVVV
jgi:hypothetical protein